jgi:N-acetylglutamate synthase-like GNAT family acetyltransferase
MSQTKEIAAEKITVRDAVEGDLNGILDLYTYLHEYDDPLPPRVDLSNLWNSIIANSLLRYFVAEYEGQLVSSCNLTIIPNLTHGAKPFGFIENVITRPEYRRNGYAQSVIDYALNAAWQSGCHTVMLLSNKHRHQAHELYEKVGFKKGVKIGYVIKPE